MITRAEARAMSDDKLRAYYRDIIDNEAINFINTVVDANVRETIARTYRTHCEIGMSRYRKEFIDRVVEMLNEAGWIASVELHNNWVIRVEW